MATQIANRFLMTLPATSRDRLLGKLTMARLQLAEMLTQTVVYFPLAGWVSLILPMTGGRLVEVGLIGREGIAGITNGVDLMVQGDGKALTMDRETFEQEREADEPLDQLVNCYQEAIHHQTIIIANCNGWHEPEQRLATWWLLTLDRSDSNHLPRREDFWEMMLCMHRPRVTELTQSLQRAGIIDYNPGHIVIRDREALEATACECYWTMRDHLERAFQLA